MSATCAISSYSCGCTIGRSNPPSYQLCAQHRYLIDNAYFPADRPFLTVPSLNPSAPRRTRRSIRPAPLVDLTTQGIEPNPGPRSANPLASLVSTVAASAANAVKSAVRTGAAKAMKKKKSQKGPKTRTPGYGSMQADFSMASLPAARGVVARSKQNITFSIPFESVQINLQQGNASTDLVYLNDNARSSASQGSGPVATPISLYSFANSGGNPVLQCLPNVMTSIAKNFSKWRIRDLKIKWVPTGGASSTTPGAIVFTVVPDPNIQQQSTNTSFSSVFATKASISTPLWQPVERDFSQCLDGCERGGDPDWKYVDFNTFNNSADGIAERQQCVGTFLAGSSGITNLSGAVAVYGYFCFSGILDLKDLILVSTI